jgi:hypothetical protein
MILAIVIYNRLKSLGQNFLIELHTGAFRKILNYIPVVTSYKGITDTSMKSIKIYSVRWNNQVFQKFKAARAAQHPLPRRWRITLEMSLYAWMPLFLALRFVE